MYPTPPKPKWHHDPEFYFHLIVTLLLIAGVLFACSHLNGSLPL